MKKSLLLAIACLFGMLAVYARDSKSLETNLYQKGVEAYNNGNYDEAEDLLLREIEENKKNALAYAWLGAIYYDRDDLKNAYLAYELAIKYMPKDNAALKSYCFTIKGEIWAISGDTIEALNCFNTAIKIDPSRYTPYMDRGDIYYSQNDYNAAYANYLAAAQNTDDPYSAYMRLGKTDVALEEYNDAIDWYKEASALYTDYYEPYFYMALVYALLDDKTNMASNLVEAIDKDFNTKVETLFEMFSGSAYNFINAKMQLKLNDDPNSFKWNYYMGLLNQNAGKYRKAIECFRKALVSQEDSYTHTLISTCCAAEGDYTQALYEIDQAAQADTTTEQSEYYDFAKAVYYQNMFMYDEAVEGMNNYIRLHPEEADAYTLRGSTKFFQGDEAGAEEDLKIAIDFGDEEAIGILASIYGYMGEPDKAKDLYQILLEGDTVLDNSNEYKTFAIYYVEGKDSVFKWMERLDAAEMPISDYNRACIYSLAGDIVNAAKYLEEDLKSNRCNYYHMQRDLDLENLHQSQKYAELLEKYRPVSVGSSDLDKGAFVERVVTIPMKSNSGGTYSIDCTVNGLPLTFIFDTGASDVSISLAEAELMLKNNYISPSDIIGSTYYSTASGSVHSGTLINLRKVKIGGVELRNVRASVVNAQSAPLLLGQTVLSRFGKVEIDYQTNSIKVTKLEMKK